MQAALSCHALWSTICIVERRGELVPPLQAAKQWIARSGNHPLSFSIGSELSNQKEVLQTLFTPHYQRWREIDFQTSFPTAILPNTPVDPTYPALQSLSVATVYASSAIHDPDEWQHSGMDKLFKLISQSPALSTIYIGSTGRNHIVTNRIYDQMSMGAPWSTLTNLSLQIIYWTPAMIVQLLTRYCPNLEFLSSQIVFPQHNPNPPPTPTGLFQHDRLKVLRFQDEWGLSVLRHVTLPALEELKLKVHPGAMATLEAETTIVKEFMKRSQCPLRTLLLDVHQNGIGVLDNTPTETRPPRMSQLISDFLHVILPAYLECLTIQIVEESPGGYKLVLDALTLPPDTLNATSSSGLSNLRSLNLAIFEWNQMDVPCMLRMLNSQFGPTGKLQSARLTLSSVDAAVHLVQEIGTHCKGFQGIRDEICNVEVIKDISSTST